MDGSVQQRLSNGLNGLVDIRSFFYPAIFSNCVHLKIFNYFQCGTLYKCAILCDR